jgi:hypothetical protein
MTIKEFSQKHSVTLFFTTIGLFVVLVFIVFSSFGRPGPGGIGGGTSRGGFNPSSQGQGIPQQGSQVAPASPQGYTGGSVTQ